MEIVPCHVSRGIVFNSMDLRIYSFACSLKLRHTTGHKGSQYRRTDILEIREDDFFCDFIKSSRSDLFKKVVPDRLNAFPAIPRCEFEAGFDQLLFSFHAIGMDYTLYGFRLGEGGIRIKVPAGIPVNLTMHRNIRGDNRAPAKHGLDTAQVKAFGH